MEKTLDYQLNDFPHIDLFGHVTDDFDYGENCACENTVVTGFRYEGAGFTVSAAINAIAATHLVNKYGQRLPHRSFDADVVKAIKNVWPGVAVQ